MYNKAKVIHKFVYCNQYIYCLCISNMATISKTQFYTPSYFWYTLMTSEYLASSRLQLVTNDSIIYKIICPQTDMHSSLSKMQLLGGNATG